eukprot:TRINITY_DN767_c0_g1_i2.p1 TRINITY_DN767_c0_g1~~TRINITY_DN767_c0_g1_i2.p1  ORF type:complete len:170 (-),score=42.99 TRINITY_DN767_c0_g1_i2:438-947(-)
MFSVSKTAVIGSAMLALASAETLSPPFLQTALEVVSRASSSSEVLSLNLTNLIILLALKVAIVAFGLFSGGATGRSGTDSELSQADMTGGMCFLLYTGGDEEKLSCIARAACDSPVSADNYLAAAKLWYKMHNIIKAVPFSEKYNKVIDVVEAANNLGKSGGECSKFGW